MAVTKADIEITNDASSCTPGPILLLAGPGTGKTYQLAKRVQFLVSEGVSPEEITIITFTKEAAKSMAAKLAEKGKPEYVEKANRPTQITTMHSLGHSVLEENAHLVGLKKGFDVVDSQKLREVLMTDAALLLGYGIKDAKAALAARNAATAKPETHITAIITEYERILRACNAIDHDDQIAMACALLSRHDAVRQVWCKRARHLLVDEYQDINAAQYQLISLLSCEHPDGLFVVGDDDQSIYQFRGGSPEYIRQFKNQFGTQARVLQMKISRRCLKNILDCANAVVARYDAERLPKADPEYTQSDAGRVEVHSCPTDAREAEIIASIVLHDREQNSGIRRTAFVLTKNKNYQVVIEETFRRLGIAYDVKTGDVESATKLAAVQGWLANPSGNLQNRLLIQIIVDAGLLPGPRTRNEKFERRVAGLKTIAQMWVGADTESKTLWKSLEAGSGLLNALFERLKRIRHSYETDFPQLLNDIGTHLKPWPDADHFFKDIATMNRKSKQVETSGLYHVRLLSMQNSKGLEAELVFIVGLDDGHMPSSIDPAAIAEEARLVFVAMTRAKEQLYLFTARKRDGAATFRSGSHGLRPSMFMTCLPKEQALNRYHPPQGKRSKVEKSPQKVR